MLHFNSVILEDSHIRSQAVSWPIAHTVPETALCVLGGFLHTHAHTHTQMMCQIFEDLRVWAGFPDYHTPPFL